VPQARTAVRRKNCGINNEIKSHYLTSQGSKNYIQWRTKRVAKEGNCTIKVSNDAKSWNTLTPIGHKRQVFPCGRNIGYESIIIKLPKSMVAENTQNGFIILQFEMSTYMGTIVQCSDMIVQKR
jgi:hypothetical protein